METIMFFILIVGAISQTWGFTTLWNWFIVPLFHAPIMTFGYAIGIGLLFSAISSMPKDREIDEQLKRAFFTWYAPPLCVGIGWIVLQFIK